MRAMRTTQSTQYNNTIDLYIVAVPHPFFFLDRILYLPHGLPAFRDLPNHFLRGPEEESIHLLGEMCTIVGHRLGLSQ